MHNLLMIGFLPEESIKVDGYVTIIHSPFTIEDGGYNAKEYEIMCNSILENTKLILVSSNKRNLTLDESFLLFSAYTNKVTIIGVGHREEQPFLDAVVSNKFRFMEDALPHIRKNY